MTQAGETKPSKSAQQALTSGRLDAVHCLLIPLQGETLLLPNAAVAEVIGYSEPDPIADAPAWLLGRISWRERIIPLISFEAASRGFMQKDGSRIAVLNTLNNNPRVPYMAILMQDIPRLCLVQPEMISYEEAETLHPSVAANVLIDGEPAVVPDIDDLEKRVANLSQN